jgi:nicotinamide riboside kinase
VEHPNLCVEAIKVTKVGVESSSGKTTLARNVSDSYVVNATFSNQIYARS